jgi:hypothetical protein
VLLAVTVIGSVVPGARRFVGCVIVNWPAPTEAISVPGIMPVPLIDEPTLTPEIEPPTLVIVCEFGATIAVVEGE